MSCSENIGFGLTKIDPWDRFQLDLIGVIDTDNVTRRELFQLSNSKTGPVTDGASYFKALEEYFEHKRNAVVEFLIHLTMETKLHLDQGTTSIPTILREYMRQCKDDEKKMKRSNIREKCELIGREQEIQKAMDYLQNKDYKGVWICGLGGMGKTSVADEVCRRLSGESPNWRIIKVELREQKHVRDLIRSALTLIGESLMTSYKEELSDADLEYKNKLNKGDYFEDFSQNSWRKLLIQKCCESSGHNKVFLLDNMDDILASDERGLMSFLDKLVNMLIEAEEDEMHQGKTTFIITSCQCLPSTTKAQILRKVFVEIKLKELSEQQAVTLFKQKNLPCKVEDLKNMASFCCYCPLALLSLSSVLKDISPSEMIESFSIYRNSSIQNNFKVIEICLHQLFSAMGKRDKHTCTLMQLYVFRTAKFDIEAAKFVCGKKEANMEFEIDHLKRYHFLESSVESFFQPEPNDSIHIEQSRQKAHSSKCYYIHSLVYQFLKSKETQFQSLIYKARERYIEHIYKTMSKTTKMSSAESLKVIAKYEPHFHTFYDYVMQLHTNSRSTHVNVPSVLNAINTEWLTDVILDTNRRCQYYKSMIFEAQEDDRILDLVYYKTCLAKLYFDNDRLEDCHSILTNIDSLIIRHERLSKEADYVKRGKKAKDYPSALVLGGFWTIQARYQVMLGNYCEAKQYLLTALRTTKKKESDCWSQIANIYNLLGIISFKSKEYKEARKYHQTALTLVEQEHDDFVDKDIFLTNIGTTFLREWDQDRRCEDALQKAEFYYSKALSMDTAKAEKRANILKFRGKLYCIQGNFDAADKDLQESWDIWRQFVHPPHINLISIYHERSCFFIKKATYMLKINDPSKEATSYLARANANYKEIQKQIEQGGVFNWQKNKNLYDQIKKNHKKVLKWLNKDEREIDQVNKFYQDFEDEKYNKKILAYRSCDLDDEFSLGHIQLMSTNQSKGSENEGSDSPSTASEASSLSITSDEEISITKNSNMKTLRFERSTDSANVALPDESRNVTGTQKPESCIHSCSVDSGMGDSITTYPSMSDSNSKSRLLSIPSGSMEEDVFSPCEKSAMNHINFLRKRKFSDRHNTCTLKRQQSFDEDLLCMGPNYAY